MISCIQMIRSYFLYSFFLAHIAQASEFSYFDLSQVSDHTERAQIIWNVLFADKSSPIRDVHGIVAVSYQNAYGDILTEHVKGLELFKFGNPQFTLNLIFGRLNPAGTGVAFGLDFPAARIHGLYFQNPPSVSEYERQGAVLASKNLPNHSDNNRPFEQDKEKLLREVFPILENQNFFLQRASSFGRIVTFDQFQRETMISNPPVSSFFLGLSYHNGLLAELQRNFSIQGPRDVYSQFENAPQERGFYSRFGVVPGESDHTQKVLDQVIRSGNPVYFFLPPDIFDGTVNSAVKAELLYLLRKSRELAVDLRHIHFVLGGYENSFVSRREHVITTSVNAMAFTRSPRKISSRLCSVFL